MDFVVREARAEDMHRVLDLIKELASFEKEENAVEIEVQNLINDGYKTPRLFHCFVAEGDDDLMGMALLYPRYSTWKGPVIHLEDLIVTKKARGSGVGSALLEAVVNYGYKLGVKRISWEVLDWNEPAIEFYEKKGARVMRDWDVVHLDEAAIRQFIDNL